jgi:hypothetical protein
MANAVYPKAKESFISQSPALDLNTDTIKLALIKISGTGAVSYSAAHQYYSSIDSGVVGTPATLASITVASGKFTATGPTFSAVSSAGNTLGFVIYKDTGTNTTSPLVAWYDTGTNIPVTPNGGDITINPDGSNGFFTI